MPSRTPTIVQCETMLIGRPIEYEMRTPVRERAGRRGDGAVVDHHARVAARGSRRA